MNQPRIHRCALCAGRGSCSWLRADGYKRSEPCKRCSGTGYHGDRTPKTKPLAPTEL